MKRCFIIQPFDNDKFDKRFDDTFEPAIKNAGLEAYRVDRDLKVEIPIVDIEKGIQEATICFAEVTTDNPNVWFELGYAIAAKKPIVLVCSKERKDKYPFDIQHRSILNYNIDSKSDFEKIGDEISEKLKAILKKAEEQISLKSISSIKEVEGLSSYEIAAMAVIMGKSIPRESGIVASTLIDGMLEAGYNHLAASLSLEALKEKYFVEWRTETDFNGNEYEIIYLTQDGAKWMIDNQKNLKLKAIKPLSLSADDDDLPF